MALVLSLADLLAEYVLPEVASYKITDQDVTAELRLKGNTVQKWVTPISNGALLKVDTGGFGVGAYKVGVENGDKLKSSLRIEVGL